MSAGLYCAASTQVLLLRTLCAEFGIPYARGLAAKVLAHAPKLHDPLDCLVLVLTGATLGQTLETYWRLIQSRYPFTERWQAKLLTDPGHLRLNSRVRAFEPHTISWQVLDLHSRRLKAAAFPFPAFWDQGDWVRDLLDANAASIAGVPAVFLHHWTFAKRMDGAIHPFLIQLELELRDPDCKEGDYWEWALAPYFYKRGKVLAWSVRQTSTGETWRVFGCASVRQEVRVASFCDGRLRFC